MSDRYLILADVRSAHNVGAIFRTADAAGVKKIFLTGHTPTPVDRFGRPHPKMGKTALGSCDFVPWEHWTEVLPLVKELQASGVAVVAVELTEKAVPLFDYVNSGSVAYVFGNEVTGVPNGVLEAADATVEIPMLGQKESLNVAVSVGIALYHDLFKRQSQV